MRAVFLVLFLLVTGVLYAQDTINKAYFDSLSVILSKDKNVKEIKFIEKRYANGKVKCQRMNVKLNNDKIDRYWVVGKYYCFYRNGQIKGYGNIDIRTKTYRDTAFSYNKDGQITYMTIYNNNSIRSEVSEPLFKMIHNEYYCYPDSFTDIEFKNGRKIREVSYGFNQSLNLYSCIYDKTFDANGVIIEEKKYKNGELIEPTAPQPHD